jgi:hypothetical protein
MEKIFFEYEDVKVTNTRFINGSNTYAMAGVTSIKLREKKPSYNDVVALIALAALILYSAFAGGFKVEIFGIAILTGVLSFWISRKKRSQYAIILSTSGGETEGLISNQLEYTNRVLGALNEAIIYRD